MRPLRIAELVKLAALLAPVALAQVPALKTAALGRQDSQHEYEYRRGALLPNGNVAAVISLNGVDQPEISKRLQAVELDPSGKLLYRTDLSAIHRESLWACAALADGRLALVAQSAGHPRLVILQRGVVTLDTPITALEENSFISKVRARNASDLILTGRADLQGVIVTIDATGQLGSKILVASPEITVLHDAVPLPDGGFAIAGGSLSDKGGRRLLVGVVSKDGKLSSARVLTETHGGSVSLEMRPGNTYSATYDVHEGTQNNLYYFESQSASPKKLPISLVTQMPVLVSAHTTESGAHIVVTRSEERKLRIVDIDAAGKLAWSYSPAPAGVDMSMASNFDLLTDGERIAVPFTQGLVAGGRLHEFMQVLWFTAK